MRLTSICLRNVGPFGSEGVRLAGISPGLNVVCETNEFGKSSILDALQLILYQPFSSTKADVKSRMHAASTDGFEGEIYFEVDGRQYCFWKRFLKRKGARLLDVSSGDILAVDRTAEEKLASLLRADVSQKGPSGLLWVKQGYSMEAVKDDGQIASRLEGELGTLIGGDRARTYLTRVNAELAEYLTPSGQEKKGGPLRRAREAVAATQSELDEALRRRDMTASIGAELSRVTADITRLTQDADMETAAQQIEQARADMTAARRFADSLELRQAKSTEAAAAAQRAATRQAEYISACVSFDKTREQLGLLDAQHEQSLEDLKTLKTQRTELRRSLSENETRRDELDRVRKRRDEIQRQTQRLETLQKDQQRLGACLEHYAALKSKQARLTEHLSDLPALTRADVESLRRAADEVQQYDIELTALSTPLYLELTEAGAGKVTLGENILSSGPVELTGGSALKIAGIGEIRSDERQLRETRRNLDRARQTQADLLAQFSVSDAAEAATIADQRHELEESRKHITAEMARLAPEGLSAIETAFHSAESEIRDLADHLEDTQAEASEAEDRDEDIDIGERLRTERAKLEVLDDALAAARQTLAKTQAEQARLKEKLTGLNLPRDLTARTAGAEKLAGETLDAEAKARALRADTEALKASAPEHSLDLLQARLTRLEAAAETARQELETLKTNAARLQARREAAFEGGDAEGVVALLEARLETEQDELARRNREKDVRVLLRDTLVETQTRLREAYTAPVMAELAPLLSRVFPGARAELGDALGVDSVLRQGKLEKIAQLSGGTQEQFAILTRLAYARLLARSGASAPVILDDALVYADDARRDAMFDVLGLVSSGETPIQILYLSCHSGATRHLGGNRITPQPW